MASDYYFYNPSSNTWTTLPAHSIPNSNTDGQMNILKLADERIWVGGDFLFSAIFDPVSNLWNPSSGNLNPPVSNPVSYYRSVLLHDGRVFVCGGGVVVSSVITPSSKAQIFDPATTLWTMVTDMPSPTRLFQGMVTLNNGKVLVAGGEVDNGFGGHPTNTCYLYDPVADTWTLTGPLITGRSRFPCLKLPDGRVLAIAGVGSSGFGGLSSCEVYDPTAGTWSAVTTETIGRFDSSGIILPDASQYAVLVAGGYGGAELSSVRVFK